MSSPPEHDRDSAVADKAPEDRTGPRDENETETETETTQAERMATAARGGPPDHPPEDVPESVRQRVEAWVPELVKRAVAAGVGAVFTTEEGIRRLTKDMPLPKDVAGYLVSTASTTKDELLRIVAREMREFLQTVNISEEIAKMLTTLSFEVKTEIRFIPNDQKYGGVEPDVKARVKLKRNGAATGASPGAGGSEAAPVARPGRRRMFRRTRRPPGEGAGPDDTNDD